MTAPVRTLLMTADAVGGVWQYARDLAAGLARHGVETRLAILGPAPSREQMRAARAVGLQLDHGGLPLDWMAPSPDALRRMAGWLAERADACGADLVHLNSPVLAAFATFAQPVLAVQHSCLATWWATVRGGTPPADFQWRIELTREGLRAADLVVAPTAAFADMTARSYGLADAPVAVWNGRSWWGGLPLAMPEDFVFTAGRLWDDGKNIAVLDRAAGRIAAPLVAAGPLTGPNGTAVAFSRLHCVDRLSDDAVAAYLERRPIYVAPALYEPFGLAVLEAAQAGCALVLSDIPSFRELWADAACFVAPGDAAAFADAVNRLLRDRDRRAALALAARQRARRYSLRSFVDALLRLYESLVVTPAPQVAIA